MSDFTTGLTPDWVVAAMALLVALLSLSLLKDLVRYVRDGS